MRQFQICVTRCQNLLSSSEGQKKITDGSRPEVISQLAELRPRPEEGGRGVSFYGGERREGGTSTHLPHWHDTPVKSTESIYASINCHD